MMIPSYITVNFLYTKGFMNPFFVISYQSLPTKQDWCEIFWTLNHTFLLSKVFSEHHVSDNLRNVGMFTKTVEEQQDNQEAIFKIHF